MHRFLYEIRLIRTGILKQCFTEATIFLMNLRTEWYSFVIYAAIALTEE